MSELLEVLAEWREARESIFATDFSKLQISEHKPFWDKLSIAEHALMDEARKLDRQKG